MLLLRTPPFLIVAIPDAASLGLHWRSGHAPLAPQRRSRAAAGVCATHQPIPSASMANTMMDTTPPSKASVEKKAQIKKSR